MRLPGTVDKAEKDGKNACKNPIQETYIIYLYIMMYYI